MLALYEQAYAGETFVEMCDTPPRLKDVTGTNVCRIFAHVDRRAGRIVVVAVIDNLMKGACGQAVQNMNLMLGLPEEEGLLDAGPDGRGLMLPSTRFAQLPPFATEAQRSVTFPAASSPRGSPPA